MRHAVVIGAGIVGVATATWLQRHHWRVTLVDRSAPGRDGASFGNAGVIARSGVAPVTTPGLITKAPAMLLKRRFPLFLRWGYLPRLAPFLLRYLSHANTDDARRISQGLSAIVGDAMQEHQALATGAARRWLQGGDYVFAYRSEEEFNKEQFVWQLRSEAGFTPEIIREGDVQAYDPALGHNIRLLAVMHEHGKVSSPIRYVGALFDDYRAAGGQWRQSAVEGLRLHGDQIAAVQCADGEIECDAAVICTGAWSNTLLKPFDIQVPMESERGYHLMLRGATHQPKNPTMIAAGKFVATPMSDGLRCAGVIEFGGLEAGASEEPFALLRHYIQETFPSMRYDAVEQWLGHRPAPSDSLPLIGQIAQTRVYTAFGHHHIGLTGGPKTARLVAEEMSGKTTMDLQAYDPMRFGQ